jgi:hypothetical protein
MSMLHGQGEQPPGRATAYPLLLPFAVGKKIDHANQPARCGMSFQGTGGSVQRTTSFVAAANLDMLAEASCIVALHGPVPLPKRKEPFDEDHRL